MITTKIVKKFKEKLQEIIKELYEKENIGLKNNIVEMVSIYFSILKIIEIDNYEIDFEDEKFFIELDEKVENFLKLFKENLSQSKTSLYFHLMKHLSKYLKIFGSFKILK